MSDGRIAALGPTPEILTQYPDARRIDGRGRAVFPGFANTHTHLSRVLARGIYEDLSPSHTPGSRAAWRPCRSLRSRPTRSV